MIRRLLLLVLAVASLGFLPNPPPAAEVQAWQSAVARRYDRDALLSFLKQTIREQKSFEGVSLSAPRLADHWTAAGLSLRSGDWNFLTESPGKDEFELSFALENESRALRLTCQREGKRSFRLVSIGFSEVIQIY